MLHLARVGKSLKMYELFETEYFLTWVMTFSYE